MCTRGSTDDNETDQINHEFWRKLEQFIGKVARQNPFRQPEIECQQGESNRDDTIAEIVQAAHFNKRFQRICSWRGD